MKKIFLVLIIGLGLGTSVFAHHDGLGIGIVGGWDWSWNSFYGPYYHGYNHGYVGLSLKTPKLPVFWGIYPLFRGKSFGIGATGDFYFIDKNIVGPLDWYLGVGAFLNTWFWEDGAELGLGVRVPVGLSWHIIKELELFLNFAPGVGIKFNEGGAWGPDWKSAIEIGLRFWK